MKMNTEARQPREGVVVLLFAFVLMRNLGYFVHSRKSHLECKQEVKQNAKRTQCTDRGSGRPKRVSLGVSGCCSLLSPFFV